MDATTGGQPLRAGLHISKLPDGRFNFSQTQAHDAEIVGIGTVVVLANGVAHINITEGEAVGSHGLADQWPGVRSSVCFSRIIWRHGQTTWGLAPEVPETRFHVASQMFGVAAIRARDGTTTHVFTGERCQPGCWHCPQNG